MVNYGVQYFSTVMSLTAQDTAQHVSILIDYGKKFVVIIGHTVISLEEWSHPYGYF
jgi:hypothetical protein